MPDQDQLFQEFPDVSKQKWLDKVIKDLRGKPLEDLNWVVNNQLTLPPFYHSEDKIGAVTLNRSNKEQNDWLIGEDFLVKDTTATNRRLLQALMNGVNAPRLIFSALPSHDELKVIFENVGLSYIHTYLELQNTPTESQALLERFQNYLETTDFDLSVLEGGIIISDPKILITEDLADNLPRFRSLSVDGRLSSVSPNAVVDVLAEILLGLDAWCQQIPERRLSHVQLHLAVGKSYFMEIAKIRAIHILWANLLEAYNTTTLTPLFIDAYLSPDAYDDSTNTNMIRSMTMALSAVIGGVDRLTVLPADQQVNEFTTRIGRNVQHLLQLESYLDRVIDPAQGSYYIEALTRRLVDLAWERLQQEK
jgi:methylmalonyl-CoA mutase